MRKTSPKLPLCALLTGFIGSILLSAATAIAGDSGKIAAPPKKADYETTPLKAAKDLLPGKLVAGKGYTVESPIRTDGFLGEYYVNTKYGRYHVRGRYALVNLIHELDALDQLQEFSDSKVFLDAAKDAGISIVTAPIRGVQAVYGAVTEPSKTYETIKKVPAGIAGLFSEIGDAFDSGYKTVKRSVVGSDKKNSKGETSASDDDSLDEAGEMATKAALSYIGYNKRESKWYEMVRVDPYTRNKPLRDKITRISGVQSAVSLGFKFVPGIGGIPYLGTVTGVLSKAEFISGYADPKEIKDKSLQLLLKLGLSEEQCKPLLDNKHFTPTALATLVDSLGQLSETKAISKVVAAASRARSPEGAWFHARAIQYVARTMRASAASFERTGDFPVVTSKNGSVAIPLPIDYVSWTKMAATEVAGLREPKEKFKVTLLIEGRVSSMFKFNAKRLGVDIEENVEFVVKDAGSSGQSAEEAKKA